MNQLKHFYNKLKKQCDLIGNKYNITLFQNISDNVYEIIQNAEPTKKKKVIYGIYTTIIYILNIKKCN